MQTGFRVGEARQIAMSDAIKNFVTRWEDSGAAERANYQLFLSELCELIDVPHPDPATPDTSANAYVFERAVTFHHGDGTSSSGRIDLYKRGCYVLEAKQGAGAPPEEESLSKEVQALKRKMSKGIGRRGSSTWDDAMLRARGQAEQYARALPAEEGRPPFLVVVDVGHSIELFSEFSCTGGTYIPFPAPGSHRIFMQDLENEEVRQRLHAVWTDPTSLDPTRRSARVTGEIAKRLAKLAVSLEKTDADTHTVAGFLMRCLFTMFAEDVGLLTKGSFTRLIESLRDSPEQFVPMVEELWDRMNRGGFSTSMRANILRFNGGLFEDGKALPLTRDQLLLLIEAAQSDWRDVEPAIFGTLLERALDPVERHKLGAHYTPRAYVERLVMPTVINPVRADWESVHTAATVYANDGDTKKAVAEIKKFHHKLVNIRVLDPACGSGNFLYVTLEHLKRIEGEVFDMLDALGERQIVLEMSGGTVDPHQLLGIEVNPRAAAIAELVLWIGTLQWHFRNGGNVNPPQPIIRNFHNIECRDALIEWDSVEPKLDDDGQPITHWDGRTTKPHPVTGKEVPDESAQTPVLNYINPRRAEWPEADYIVGNPPFIGNKRMRQTLGDGYVDVLRHAYDSVPASVDYVMYWWHRAANLARANILRRFGLITTNSITQTQSGQVVRNQFKAKNHLSLAYAIPDHPWVDAELGAAVRISMTVAVRGDILGTLGHVVSEKGHSREGSSVSINEQKGKISPDFSIGATAISTIPLRANDRLCWQGCKLVGKHFQIAPEKRETILKEQPECQVWLKTYWAGSDITKSRRLRYVIDLFGLHEEEARLQVPLLYQHLRDWVYPERKHNKDKTFREKWWLFGRPRPELRAANAGLHRFIVTSEVAKFHTFQFLQWPEDLIDGSIIGVSLSDAFHLGVLSSRIHNSWSLTTGGRLESRPRYQNGPCFDPFPFPSPTLEQELRIRDLGEQLDAHRKSRQAEHADITMTGMYNVLEKLRSGETLTAKEKVIHEHGLVSVLKQIHDDLDAAVFDAYGWPADLSDEQILEKLVALNAERAAEEAKGKIRYLRPDFQNPAGTQQQPQLDVPTSTKHKAPSTQHKAPSTKWPKSLPDQVRLVRETLTAQTAPATPETIARHFTRARTDKVLPILQTLVTVGQAQQLDDGRFVGLQG
jgi:hypothetical protein